MKPIYCTDCGKETPHNTSTLPIPTPLKYPKPNDQIKTLLECNECEHITLPEEVNEYNKHKKKPNPIVPGINLRIDSYTENVEKFYEHQPYFYDKTGLFWFWKDNKYQPVDDIDLMNSLDEILGFGGLTIASRIKNDYIEAFKRHGRTKIPLDTHKTTVQLQDTIINIKTQETHKVGPESYSTNPIPWKIGTTEDTPIMDKIFEEWVGKKRTKLLYQVIAYTMLPDYPIHRIFCLIGRGRNGKGKFLELLTRFIGTENTTSTDLDLLLTGRFETAKLHKKLACVMGETNFNAITKASLLKRLVGQDLIGFEFKNKKPFDDYNYAKILIATNQLPTTTDKTEGFYRRWVIIDFNNQFNEKEDVLERVPDVEYSNLAKKSIRILKELLVTREFDHEGSVEDRMKAYEDKSNPLKKFLDSQVTHDSNRFIYKWEFRDRFFDWQRQQGYNVWTETHVGVEMKKLYEEGKRTNPDDATQRWFAWVGIDWKSEKSKVSKVSTQSHSTPAYGNLSRNGVDTLDTPDSINTPTKPVYKKGNRRPNLYDVIGALDTGNGADVQETQSKMGCNDKDFIEYLEHALKSGNIMRVRGDRLKIV